MKRRQRLISSFCSLPIIGRVLLFSSLNSSPEEAINRRVLLEELEEASSSLHSSIKRNQEHAR
jgi:hypothetical protein